jgi:hypothetical protein
MLSQTRINDTDAPGKAAGRAQRGEIVTHAPALLHRQSPLLEAVTNTLHGIIDPAHDKTVEQGDVVTGPGTRQDAPPGKKPEIAEDRVIALSPTGLIAFLLVRERLRYPLPTIFDRLIDRLTRSQVTIAAAPDLAGDFDFEGVAFHAAHRCGAGLAFAGILQTAPALQHARPSQPACGRLSSLSTRSGKPAIAQPRGSKNPRESV